MNCALRPLTTVLTLCDVGLAARLRCSIEASTPGYVVEAHLMKFELDLRTGARDVEKQKKRGSKQKKCCFALRDFFGVKTCWKNDLKSTRVFSTTISFALRVFETGWVSEHSFTG